MTRSPSQDADLLAILALGWLVLGAGVAVFYGVLQGSPGYYIAGGVAASLLVSLTYSRVRAYRRDLQPSVISKR